MNFQQLRIIRETVRRGFIELCQAELTEAKVTQALRNDAQAEAF